jgi:hypothetical protein
MGRKQGNMVCEYPGCNYEIYWKYKMNRHVKSVHKKEKDLLCEVCQKTFRCNFSLNRHKRLKHKPNSQKCPKSIQNDSQQESKPVVIHFMSKKARATVTSQESFVADNENAPIQTDFEVEKSVENHVPEKHDKRFQPVLQLEKLKKKDIAMYLRKDTLQPKNSLTKFNNLPSRGEMLHSVLFLKNVDKLHGLADCAIKMFILKVLMILGEERSSKRPQEAFTQFYVQ